MMKNFKKGDLIIASKGLPLPNGSVDYDFTRNPYEVLLVTETHIVLYDAPWKQKIVRTIEEMEKRDFIAAPPELVEIIREETAQ